MAPGSSSERKVDLTSDATLAFAIARAIDSIVAESLPELASAFPFQGRFDARFVRTSQRIVFRIWQDSGHSFPSIGTFKSGDPGREEAGRLLGLPGLEGWPAEWESPTAFAYVGPQDAGIPRWPEIMSAAVEWLNSVVLPHVLELNRKRVALAIPPPPSYVPTAILSSTVVIDDGSRQGTAFLLDGLGLVTCHHVVSGDSYLVDPRRPSQRHRIEVVRASSALDLAVLSTGTLALPPLRRGSSDALEMHQHVASVGFPNYRLGDSGVLVPGIVVGFRPKSGVRRILTNAYVVGGMSGGPAIGPDGAVVGVLVTGADRLESADDTEDRGIIPIDALDLM